ncbi:MAG: tripartite tricarboxylate transporter substrate binding protein [Betaproteobacteria bacterium]|nr:tripartite tricarboxylate transporter substrate binding protein [Betaproteobacteria bacterium]
MAASPLQFNRTRSFAAGACAAAALLVAPGVAMAQAWKPQQQVEIIVGSAAGSSPDTMARMIQRIWQEKRLLEVPATVMNRVGGGNTIAWTFLNQRPGDGHYLMISNINLSAGHLTGTSTFSYRDFTALGILFHEYIALSVNVDSPIKDGKDLLARLKQDPGSASLGVSSVAGGANHLAAGLAFKTAGIDVKKIRTVVFDSAGKVMTATLGGHVDLASTSITAALRQVRAGKVRVLGVSAPRRLGGEMAQFPTWREQGAEVDFSNYRGMIGPKGLSIAQVAYWEGVLAALDRDESWRAHLEKTQLDRQLMTGRETIQYQDQLDGKLRTIFGELGLLK